MIHKAKFDYELFARSIQDKMYNERLRFRDVGIELGINHTVIYRASKGQPVNLDNFAQICEWLRIEPREFFYVEVTV